jgi:hypothetical protein
MQNTKTHDTKIADTKTQETAPGKSGSGTSVHPPKVIAHQSKGVKALVHESHKIEYRRDHPKAVAGVKIPSASVRK